MIIAPLPPDVPDCIMWNASANFDGVADTFLAADDVNQSVESPTRAKFTNVMLIIWPAGTWHFIESSVKNRLEI